MTWFLYENIRAEAASRIQDMEMNLIKHIPPPKCDNNLIRNLGKVSAKTHETFLMRIMNF